jgi:hypothetical protein
MTNPQSFNRYAYVQNDPVNFVDPLGLDHDTLGPPPPVPTLIPYGGTIVTNTSAPRPGSGGVGSIFSDVNFVPEEAPEEGPGGPTGGGEPQEPAQDQDIAKRIAEGQAWDRWYAWVKCNTPILNKYNEKLSQFHKDALWKEVGIGIAVATALGSVSWGPDTDMGTGAGPSKNIMSGGVVARGWLSVLAVVGVIYWERNEVKKIQSDYYAEVGKVCGPKPPHP